MPGGRSCLGTIVSVALQSELAPGVDWGTAVQRVERMAVVESIERLNEQTMIKIGGACLCGRRGRIRLGRMHALC